MARIISQSTLGKYTVLVIDEETPKTQYKKYKIDGNEYDIVPVSNMKKTIAIQTKEDLVGKAVEFI